MMDFQNAMKTILPSRGLDYPQFKVDNGERDASHGLRLQYRESLSAVEISYEELWNVRSRHANFSSTVTLKRSLFDKGANRNIPYELETLEVWHPRKHFTPC